MIFQEASFVYFVYAKLPQAHARNHYVVGPRVTSYKSTIWQMRFIEACSVAFVCKHCS